MIVAVTMRVVSDPATGEARDAVSHDWIELLGGYGVRTLLVPNGLPDPVAYVRAYGARGLLLTGGNDCLAGPTPGSPPAPARDNTEHALLDDAIERNFPVFGVCRGLHVINLHFRGRLETDLSAHAGVTHEVELTGPMSRDGAANGRVVTNSYHRQGVLLDGLSGQLDAFAVATGGVVEGLRHRALPVTAVQWHPERPNPAIELDRSLLTEWLSSCA